MYFRHIILEPHRVASASTSASSSSCIQTLSACNNITATLIRIKIDNLPRTRYKTYSYCGHETRATTTDDDDAADADDPAQARNSSISCVRPPSPHLPTTNAIRIYGKRVYREDGTSIHAGGHTPIVYAPQPPCAWGLSWWPCGRLPGPLETRVCLCVCVLFNNLILSRQ